jgi:S1-C subfamily serine protease
MKNICLAVIVLLTALSGTPVKAQTGLSDLVERLKPSIALVRAGDACGSAFVVDSSGILVTALHVVAEVDRAIAVQFPGGSPQPADVLAVNIKNDLAILRVAQQGLMPIPLAEMSDVRVGQEIVLLGYPLCNNPDPSVAKGIVSGLNRASAIGSINVFQMDIAMTHGESGGPILTMDGRVIGVVDQFRFDLARLGQSIVAVGQPLNYGVPADAVKALFDRVLEPGKLHAAIALPLESVITRTMAYKDSANGFGKKGVGVACVSPPDGALSLSRIRGELKANEALNILVWVSPQGSSGDRIATLSKGAVTTDSDIHAQPVAVCLNFIAQANSVWVGPIIPFGFEVSYTVDYRVWSPEVLASQNGGTTTPNSTSPPSAAVPSPATPPSYPAPSTPSPAAPSTSHNPLRITPGQGIGHMQVGMSLTDVIAILGRPKVTMPYSKSGSDTLYAWFDYTRLGGNVGGPPSSCTTYVECWKTETDTSQNVDDGGLAVVCTRTGQVSIVQAYYAPQYVTTEGLHTNVTEEQVRSVLGEPTRVVSGERYHSLEYVSKGIMFRVADDPKMKGYRTVFLISVSVRQP